MRKINYSLIISDFDGTLVCENGTIGDKNKTTIAQYVKDGGNFAISTGRLHYGILPRAQELGLTGAISCCQGALIMDLATGKPLLNGTFTNEQTIEMCRQMEALDLHIHLYDFDEYYVNMDDDALKIYEGLTHKKGTIVTDMPLSQLAKEKGLCAYKLLAIVHPKDNARVLESLQSTCVDGLVVTKSAEYLVEIINANYSKGTAVRFLADYYKVPIEKTIGIGDQWNDLPMIQTAGLGIAVKNANERLKAHAVTIDYTNEEDAVAEVIKKYGYMED